MVVAARKTVNSRGPWRQRPAAAEQRAPRGRPRALSLRGSCARALDGALPRLALAAQSAARDMTHLADRRPENPTFLVKATSRVSGGDATRRARRRRAPQQERSHSATARAAGVMVAPPLNTKHLHIREHTSTPSSSGLAFYRALKARVPERRACIFNNLVHSPDSTQ